MKSDIYLQSISGGIFNYRPRHGGQIVSLAIMILMLLFMGQALAGTQINAAHPDDEALAVFDEAEADFGETEASFDNEANAVSGKAPGSLSLFTAPDPARISHSEHYAEARYFPDRQPRKVSGIHHSWLIPLALILGMVPLVSKKGNRPSKKPADTAKTPRFRTALDRKISLLMIALSCVLFSASSSQAIVYSPVKDAVTNMLGKEQKIYQTKVTITPEAGTYLKKNLGWSPDKTSYKAYYAKAADGKPQRYAFVLSDRLEICGGLHKYCVAVDADGTVYGVSILELTCDRSYCINARSFLAQFKGYNTHNHAQKAKAYDAMSGATLSTDLTRDIVQRALALMSIMNGQYHG